ncbi:hypothetical protein LEB92_22420, partial [Salmonella enterica]|nr:hypothetical protein [Salmonella enterica]
ALTQQAHNVSTDSGDKAPHNMCAKKKKDENGRAAGAFSIGSAPLTSITESDAQISGGETRQDYKDTRRFPLVTPSCALLFLPFGLPVSFRCYGRVYLIPRLTLSSG